MRYTTPILCCMMLALSSATAKAQFSTYTAYSSGNPFDSTYDKFSGTVGTGVKQTIDFDASSLNGAVINNGNTASQIFNAPVTATTTTMTIVGITNMKIKNSLVTTSGTQYLANTANANNGLITPATSGATITFTPLDKPLSAFGLYVLTSYQTTPFSFTLTATNSAGGTQTATSGVKQFTDDSTVDGYFVGFTDASAVYTKVDLSFASGTTAGFYIDDVRYTAAPELHFIVAIAAVFLLSLKVLLGRIGLGIL